MSAPLRCRCTDIPGAGSRVQRYKLFFIYANEKWLILTNSTFCVLGFFGRSLVLPWFFLGLLSDGDREGTIEKNLNKSAF